MTGSTISPANQLDIVTDAITRISGEAKSLLEKQAKDIKLGVDGELAKTNGQLNTVAEKLMALQAEQKRLADILADVETGRAKTPPGSKSLTPATKSLGYRVTRSKEYALGVKAARNAGARNPSFSVPVGGGFWGGIKRVPKDLVDLIAKAALEGKTLDFDDDSAGTGVNPQYIPGLVEFPKVMPLIRQLCPSLATSETNVVKMDREKQQLLLAAKITATNNAGATTLEVDNITGWQTDSGWNTIYLDNGSDPIETNAVSAITANANGDGGGVLTVTATGINLAIGDRVYAQRFGITPEGELAPRMVEELEDYEVPICELSAIIRANSLKLEDIVYAEQYIEQRLLNALARMEDLHCFYGPGGSSPSKIKGIFADSAVASSTRTGVVTYIDHILAGIYSVWGRYYQPTDVVVALGVHQALTQAKDSTGRYLFWSNQQAGTPMQLHVCRLHAHNQLDALHGVVGNFQQAATILDREESSVEVGYNNDDFARRKKSILAHERVGFAIAQPSALQRLVF